jgi:UDP-glucose 4-epimerase
MHILVTGGAGYVGSATAAYFLAAGHRVTVYDSLVKGHRAAVPEGADFVQGDVGDAAALDVLFQMGQFDAVAHFAAFIEAGRSFGFRPVCMESTSIGLRRVSGRH